MRHIVSYSGGAGSYMAAKRVIEQHGKENVLLVFTDTKTEDEDLYRFLEETVSFLGAEYKVLEDGRDIWEVMHDKHYLCNTRVDYCSMILKRELFRNWVEENFKPEECIIYLGIDWTEEHRFSAGVINRWEPYTVKAPMIDPPYMIKKDMLAEIEKDGIELPRLYKMGFAHNNCGGFCVKAGHGQFKQLLEKMPERFKYHEEKEQELRAHIKEYHGKDVAILRDRRGGTTKPLTLKEFRERIENDNKVEQLEFDDFGGCGCFI